MCRGSVSGRGTRAVRVVTLVLETRVLSFPPRRRNLITGNFGLT